LPSRQKATPTNNSIKITTALDIKQERPPRNSKQLNIKLQRKAAFYKAESPKSLQFTGTVRQMAANRILKGIS